MNITHKCQRELFKQRVRMFGDLSIAYIEPSIIVMSHKTMMEIRREGGVGISSRGDKFCGVRVAYDDDLSLGEVIIGEILT